MRRCVFSDVRIGRMEILITSNLTRCLGFNFRWKQRRQKVSVTTSEPWKKTGKDSGIRAFISVSTWEISTLYRVLPLCLCLLSSFRVSVEKKGMHSAACKLWGWTLGLCFVSLSGRRGRRGGSKRKKEGSGEHYYVVGTRDIFASHPRSTSKLNNFPDVYELDREHSHG